MVRNKHIFILPFVLIGLLLGMWTGLLRIGLSQEGGMWLSKYTGYHGALMAGSFIGTLICLERALGFKNRISLIVPAISSLSIVLFILDFPQPAYITLLAGSIGLVIMYLIYLNKFSEIHMVLMLIGALCWLLGNAILLKTNFYPSAVMWWIAFVFFTITGERIELSRYLQISNLKKNILVILMMIYIIGILVPFHDFGGYLIGFSFIASGVWLFRYDMARRSIKREGQHFFSGLVLLFGYGWLIICGLFMAYGSYSGLLYDPAVHSFFLGFVFSMIFAHAPIILPGVLKITINPFNRSLYIWFILLQLSLALRIVGSLSNSTILKLHGGILNALAILGFFISMAILVRKGKNKL